jgi:hypothetical protein
MFKRKKLFIIIFIVVILILVVGGFFYLGNYYREKKIREDLVKEFFNFNLGILPEGFMANQISGDTILENKNIGISFKVPTGWTFIGYMDHYIDLKSSDYETDPNTLIRLGGCLITINTSYYTLFTSSNLISRIDRLEKGNIRSEDGEVIKVNNISALKIVDQDEWLSKDGIEEIIEVGVPFINTKSEVKFSTKIFKNQDKCVQEFNKFLETVYIK